MGREALEQQKYHFGQPVHDPDMLCVSFLSFAENFLLELALISLFGGR